MTFLIDNLYLIAMALVSGGLLLWPLLKRGGGATSLSPLEATQLINHRNAIVVDVRDEQEFAAGSLAAARNLPFTGLAARAGELVRFKARPVLIVCGSGQQSAKAIEQFKSQGFEEAYSLSGGIAAWKQAGLPLVQATRESVRPTGRPAIRDAGRKAKGDRSADRGRSGKSSAPALAPAGLATSTDADPVPSPPQAANDDDPATPRVKELS